MTYEELVLEVQNNTKGYDAKKITDHLAIQVNIEGEAEGAFYIEMLRGNIVVEPYEYYDRDVLLICQAAQILEILKGDLDPMEALKDGQVRAEGNVGRLGLFAEIIRKTPRKKVSKAAKSAKTVKTENTAKSAKTTKTENAAKPAKTVKTEKADKTVKSTKTSKTSDKKDKKTT